MRPYSRHTLGRPSGAPQAPADQPKCRPSGACKSAERQHCALQSAVCSVQSALAMQPQCTCNALALHTVCNALAPHTVCTVQSAGRPTAWPPARAAQLGLIWADFCRSRRPQPVARRPPTPALLPARSLAPTEPLPAPNPIDWAFVSSRSPWSRHNCTPAPLQSCSSPGPPLPARAARPRVLAAAARWPAGANWAAAHWAHLACGPPAKVGVSRRLMADWFGLLGLWWAPIGVAKWAPKQLEGRPPLWPLARWSKIGPGEFVPRRLIVCVLASSSLACPLASSPARSQFGSLAL